jgi:hypothetical protein
VIKKLKEYQGQYVKLEYEERLTFFFWGDTKYFITGHAGTITISTDLLFSVRFQYFAFTWQIYIILIHDL